MQLSGRIEEKSKEKKRYCIAWTMFSSGAIGETESKEGLVQNAASPRPGICRQSRVRDGHWSPISVQAVESSILGSRVVAGASYSERPQCVGELMTRMSAVRWTRVSYRLSEDGSIG